MVEIVKHLFVEMSEENSFMDDLKLTLYQNSAGM